ncbi:MAG TPA: ATP-binding protein [Phycisphaerae bacterium]|nr:ATP-binding protein [Phycisphaerae bacterium]
MSDLLNPTDRQQVAARTAELLHAHLLGIRRQTDRLFAGLLAAEWVGGVIWALLRAPFTWEGNHRAIHPHVWQAIILGALIAALPIFLALCFPCRALTRHIIGISQMLSCALLIHISGGRIETHFEIFGSLAFLAFYRDWRVLISASVIVAADHLIRNYLDPQSVYGVLTPGNWRWVEHAAWVVFEDIFLVASCRRSVSEMHGIAEHRAMLEQSHSAVEDKVRQRTAQLHEAQDELLKVARSAGMAEIATSVLHNVGNVLNSVNVSVRVAATKVERSPVGNLSKAVGMMAAHKNDLGEFLTTDERGKRIPEFLEAVAEALASEQADVLSEMNTLQKNVEHIKEIVAVQQSHAKAGPMVQQVQLRDLLEDAVKITRASSRAANVQIDLRIDSLPDVLTDKHALLQILINLLSNARHAVGGNTAEKRVTLSAACAGNRILIDVTDNGVGIPPENLTRIFNHGFTTRKEGHGFGLHASANAAKNLGGSLRANSDGPGKGATFTLELPMPATSARSPSHLHESVQPCLSGR